MTLNRFRHATLSALTLGAALAISAPAALGQGYPTSNPTYIPQAILASQTIVASSNYPFMTNGVGTIILDITGSPSGLSATLQGTSSRAASGAVWTNITVDVIGGVRISTIAATGKYRANIAGYAQVRLAVASGLTGATAFVAAAGPGAQFMSTLFQTRATFSASALIGTGATTHFMSMAGSATKTIRVEHVECSGGATAANDVSISAEVDSAADTGDAGTAITPAPHDSTNVAATAVVLSHTTSPTPGALVGYARTGNLLLAKLGTTTPTGGTLLSWDFGPRPGGQEIVLRGVAQSFSLDTNAAFGSGAAVGCTMEWSEE